jgi:hypothetical protein
MHDYYNFSTLDERLTLVFPAVPHSDVEVRDFYKHIEDGLPEPKRMRQLLTWCGTRVLPEKAKGTGNMNEDLAVDAGMSLYCIPIA